MKKLLLTIAAVAVNAVMAYATDYLLFDGNGKDLGFKGDGKGWSTEVTVNGKTFKIETAKANGTNNLTKPASEIRVYKSSQITISSTDVAIKQVTLTSSGSKYNNALVSEGWTITQDNLINTAVNKDGTTAVTFDAPNGQFRVKKLVVSDEITEVEKPVAVSVRSVEETIAKDNKTLVAIDYPLTVGFVNKGNVFCRDEAGDFIQIYGSNTYHTGDIIPAGWEATYELYNENTPELIPASALPAAIAGTFTPRTVSAGDITTELVNNVVLVENVVLSEASPATKDNFTGTSNGVSLSLRNNYTLPSVDPGTYDITLVVTIYQEAPSLYVIDYKAKTSGIDTVGNDTDTKAVYYNLNGIRIDNPGHGLYIRVQGANATKVIL